MPKFKITITLEDMPNNKVKMEMNPSGATISKMIQSGEKSTSAMALALVAVHAILLEQKNQGRSRPLIIPTLVN